MDPARVPSAPAPPDYRTPCAYVENCIRGIMRSERLCGVCGDDATVAAGSGAESPHIILWSADAVQHGDQLVGRSETAGFEHRHRRHGERFKLLCWIRAQIDFRALKAGMLNYAMRWHAIRTTTFVAPQTQGIRSGQQITEWLYRNDKRPQSE